MTDRYIKFTLTVIAGLLGILVLHGVLKVPEAQARQPLECKISNELPIPVVVSNGPDGLLVHGSVTASVASDLSNPIHVRVMNTAVDVCNRCR
jgi:hypothetical protein